MKHDTFDNLLDSLRKFPSEYTTDECCHYTTMNGITGIFNKYIDELDKAEDKTKYVKECSFRASNIRYLNDTQEVKEGKDYLKTNDDYKEIIKEIEANDICTICFCGDEDLLSQWNMYGKNSGISIKFDFTKIKTKFFDDPDLESSRLRNGLKPIKLIYNGSKKRNKSPKKFLEAIKISGLNPEEKKILAANIFVSLCKNKAFYQEDESRLVFFTPPLPSIQYDFDYVVNESAYTVKPALNVTFEHNDKTSKDNIIKSLVVGPGVNQDLVFNSLIHIFDRKNYKFQEEPKNVDAAFSWSYFTNNDECVSKVLLVECDNKNVRYAYRCENGIIIMKSAIPFRG